MKKILFVYTLGVLLMFSCKREASLASSHRIKPSADSISPRFLSSSIILEKTGCPETCEDYHLEILGSGKAVFLGKANVKKIGRYERVLSPLEVNTLFNKFECARFFEFGQVYTGSRTDSSFILLTFNHRGSQKTIKEEADGPVELKKLQDLVQGLRKSGDWIKITP